MKRAYNIIVVLTALLLLACSKEPAIVQVSDIPIAFRTEDGWSVTPTKDGTTPAPAPFDGDSFAVLSRYFPAGGGSPRQYMWNQKIVRDGSAWTYSPLKYWPATLGDKLSFYAYAPHVAAATASVANDGSIHMSIPLDGNKDLVWAQSFTANNQTHTPGSQLTFPEGRNGINFSFRHLMKRIRFNFLIKPGGNFGYGHSVNRLTVPGQYSTVILNLESGDCTFEDRTATYLMAEGSRNYPIITQNEVSGETTSDFIYLPPDVNEITVNMRVSGVDYVANIGGLGEGNSGSSFLIKLEFDANKVTPTVELIPWVTAVDNDQEVLIEWK